MINIMSYFNRLVAYGQTDAGLPSTITPGTLTTTILPSNLVIHTGNSVTGTTLNQLLLQGSTTNYAHAIKTRHNAAGTSDNAIDLFVWQYGTDAATAVGSRQALTISQTGVGINQPYPTSALQVGGTITATGNISAGGGLTGSAASISGTLSAASLIVSGTLSAASLIGQYASLSGVTTTGTSLCQSLQVSGATSITGSLTASSVNGLVRLVPAFYTFNITGPFQSSTVAGNITLLGGSQLWQVSLTGYVSSATTFNWYFQVNSTVVAQQFTAVNTTSSHQVFYPMSFTTTYTAGTYTFGGYPNASSATSDAGDRLVVTVTEHQ